MVKSNQHSEQTLGDNNDHNTKGVNRMTSSTISTVSTEEVQRFAQEMAETLGLTHFLQMESWANPNMRHVPLPDTCSSMRNNQLRLRAGNSQSPKNF